MQLDLEEDKTTYRHDYKKPKVLKHDYTWKRAQYNDFPEIKRKPPVFEDHETFDKRAGSHIPFNLLWECKPITQTHPQHLLIRKVFPKDDEFERKDRPRVIMSPAVSLDDARETLANEAVNQDLLTQYTYTTTWQKASQEAALPTSPRDVPSSTYETTADPVRYHCEDNGLIPKGWQKLATSWDKVQSHSVSDPTRAFWEQTAIKVKCGACEQNICAKNLVDPETQKKN